MKKNNTLLIIALFIFYFPCGYTLDIKDPTMPPLGFLDDGAADVEDKDKKQIQKTLLTGILISKEEQVAVIDGQKVKAGSLVNGMSVSKIFNNKVELLDQAGNTTVLELVKDIKKED
jgi:hypothetical protein